MNATMGFMFLRTWFPALAVVATVAAALVFSWERGTVPAMMEGANEELLADLRDAVEERAKSIAAGAVLPAEGEPDGVMDPLPAVGDPDRFLMQMIRRKDAVTGELLMDGYFAGRSANPRNNRSLDAYGREIRHEVVEGRYRAVSAGLDGVFGTADDRTSDGARSRFQEKLKEPKKKKAAAGPEKAVEEKRADGETAGESAPVRE